MSTAAEYSPPEPPEDAQRPAEGARSGADAGWAVPGVTGQSPAPDGSGSPAAGQAPRDRESPSRRGSSRSRGSSRGGGSSGDRARGRAGSRSRSGDVDPVDVLTTEQEEALAGVSDAIALLAQVAGSVSGVQALTVCQQVHALTNQLSGVHAQVVAIATAGQAWTADGHASAPRWLATTHLVSFRVARDRVADADWLTEYPMFAESLGAGRISAAHVTVLRCITAATATRRAAFAEVAVYWVTVAQGRDPETLAALLRAWAALVDDTEDDKAEKAWRNRALRVSQVGDEWAISGRLPAVEGARLSAVLNEIMDIDRRTHCGCEPGTCACGEDERTITQRRADALLAIVDAVTARAPSTRRPPPPPEQQPQAQTGATAEADTAAATDPGAENSAEDAEASEPQEAPQASSWSPQNPESGSQPGRPPDPASRSDSESPPGSPPGLAPGWNSGRLGNCTRVVLVIRAEDLSPLPDALGSVPGPSTRPEDAMSMWATANGPGAGLLARATMLRELCDTTVQRLIVGPDSQPLDIGRATRTIPNHIRTALHVRDRGCCFPGCDRPPGWTEAHHIQTWAAGGGTSVQNLASLCRLHHSLIHTGEWTIQIGADGHPEVTKVRTYPIRN